MISLIFVICPIIDCIYDISWYIKYKKSLKSEEVIVYPTLKRLNIKITYTNLYNLDYNAQSIYQLCEINRNIVNFYCKGYDCKVPGSCIDRWDFDPSKLDGKSFKRNPSGAATKEWPQKVRSPSVPILLTAMTKRRFAIAWPRMTVIQLSF